VTANDFLLSKDGRDLDPRPRRGDDAAARAGHYHQRKGRAMSTRYETALARSCHDHNKPPGSLCFPGRRACCEARDGGSAVTASASALGHLTEQDLAALHEVNKTEGFDEAARRAERLDRVRRVAAALKEESE